MGEKGSLANLSMRRGSVRWSFELFPRDQKRLILKVKIPMMTLMQVDNGEEKQGWLAALVTRSMLECYLEVILRCIPVLRLSSQL